MAEGEFIILQTHSKLKKLLKEGFQEDKLLTGKFATLGSKSFEIKLPKGVQATTIAELKGLIEDQEAIPIEELEILRRGVAIPDESTLSSQFIRSGARILYARKDEMTNDLLTKAEREKGGPNTKQKHASQYGSETMTIVREEQRPEEEGEEEKKKKNTSDVATSYSTAVAATNTPNTITAPSSSSSAANNATPVAAAAAASVAGSSGPTIDSVSAAVTAEEADRVKREQRQKMLEAYQKRTAGKQR